MNLRCHSRVLRTDRLAGFLALGLALLCVGAVRLHAAEPQAFAFRTNDVIAFVGGEDVVEMQRNGYLELLLTAAKPELKLRFRNLAFEGDTVFEQHRQLNFPSWEKQLERVGATVVVAQFGQAESLQGTNGLGKFVEAYGKLLDRFTNGGRRLALLSPTPLEDVAALGLNYKARARDLQLYASEIFQLACRRQNSFVDPSLYLSVVGNSRLEWTRDGLHLNPAGQWLTARAVANGLGSVPRWVNLYFEPDTGRNTSPRVEKLRQLIVAKNRLWFDYWRPQNWAFLHGDRTEQASSRDHRDPKKRWFPEEMEKFLPLIEAKEQEIWKLAAELK